MSSLGQRFAPPVSPAALLIIVTLALILILPVTAAANPVDAFGMGARAVGLGGAGGALITDFSATYYNPANLALAGDLRIDVGYQGNWPTLKLNGGDLGVDAPQGMHGGIILGSDAWGHRFALGLGLYLPNERLTRLRALPEAQPRFVLYDNRPQRLVLNTSAALEVIKERLFFGFGLTFLSDTEGTLDIEGTVDFLDADQTTLLGGVDVRFDAVRYWSVGLTIHPWEHLKVGLTFRDEFALKLDIGVSVKGDIVTGAGTDNPVVIAEDAEFDVSSVNTNLFSPRQLNLSLAWDAPRWRIAADLAWLQWSRFPSATAKVSFILDIPNLPIAIPPTPSPAAPDFNDIWVPRLGVEGDVVDGEVFGLQLRGGFWYQASPAPDQSGVTNYADSDKVGFSFGVGMRFSEFSEVFPKPILLDLAVTYIVLDTRRVNKDEPADEVGDYVIDGQILGFQATTSLLF